MGCRLKCENIRFFQPREKSPKRCKKYDFSTRYADLSHKNTGFSQTPGCRLKSLKFLCFQIKGCRLKWGADLSVKLLYIHVHGVDHSQLNGSILNYHCSCGCCFEKKGDETVLLVCISFSINIFC